MSDKHDIDANLAERAQLKAVTLLLSLHISPCPLVPCTRDITKLYPTRPPQNSFPIHTVNYLLQSLWDHYHYPQTSVSTITLLLWQIFVNHPGLNIRDIAKPYSSTPANSLSKHCVSFVLTLLRICTLLSLWLNFMFNLRVLAQLFTPFVIVQLQ